MMAVDPLADHGLPARRRRFASIQDKLERVLRSKNTKLWRYRAEVASIVDALDALNRDSDVLKKRRRRGDFNVD